MMPNSSLLVAGSALALLSFLLSGCGDEVGNEADVSAVGASTTEPPTIKDLSCPNDERSGGTLDYFGGTGGAESVEVALVGFVKSDEDVVVAERSAVGATAYLLRPHGTAYSRLDLVVLTDSTWRIDGVMSCSGEEPFPR